MSKAERIFLTVFGIFLSSIGIYAIWLDRASPMQVGGGLMFILFGGNMIYAALRRKPSWLSRIGPLP